VSHDAKLAADGEPDQPGASRGRSVPADFVGLDRATSEPLSHVRVPIDLSAGGWYEQQCTGAVCLSTVAFLVGEVAVVGGVILFATASRDADKKTMSALGITAAPAFDGGSAGISMQGEW
jgi:hypothetical protein